jgi:predicted dehydrogenase
MATWRPGTRVLGWLPGATPEAVEAPGATRLLLLALRHALGIVGPAPVRVGLLGYGAIGDEHRRAVEHVPGLVLSAVCDASPARLEAVRAVAPAAALHASAQALLADPGVDLVVVSTPPDTHATWARAALAAGKHVVVEKPFALTTAEVDGLLAQARARGLLASCYQNRRFDPDHLALRRLARSGRLGELFHLEAFVGGYGHPCNLWHSDAGTSGGAVYDWGAHVVDQLLDLVPDDVEHVSATEHRRVWHDVTNADHARVTIRFAGGAEATFVHSDIAAALKPRWYVLGTGGAVVGSWRAERVVSRSDIGTLVEDVLAPADAPPLLDLHAPDGSVTRLATPPGRPYAYHAELADSLRFGLPTTVTPVQSRRVVAVLEAAETSARSGGGPVTPR